VKDYREVMGSLLKDFTCKKVAGKFNSLIVSFEAESNGCVENQARY
jgi:hypothetical protein